MKVFIAGVMQGNRKDHLIHPQDYRKIIAEKLSSIVDEVVEVVDPDKTDPDRLNYTHDQAKEMFIKYCHIAGQVDMLFSYVPEASMGSAVEMWMAHQSNIPIITISTMKANWVVKILSDKVYEDLNDFCDNFDSKTLKSLAKRKVK